MAFNIVDDVVVQYDDKVERDIINPAEWNANFKAIENTSNANTSKINNNFNLLSGVNGSSEIGITSLIDGTPTNLNSFLTSLYSLVVKNIGDETIGGTKTFSSSPIVPTPTQNGHATSKQYVDLLAASISQGAVADNSITNNKLGSDIKVGSLAGLSTTSKSTLVSAINELVANINSISGSIPTVPTIVNNLTETVAGKTLDATQGKILKDSVDIKADKATTSDLKTTSFTVTSSIEARLQKCYSANTINITVPSDANQTIGLEKEFPFLRLGAGAVTFVADSGVTIRSVDGKLSIDKQYQTVYLKKIANNEWVLFGALA